MMHGTWQCRHKHDTLTCYKSLKIHRILSDTCVRHRHGLMIEYSMLHRRSSNNIQVKLPWTSYVRAEYAVLGSSTDRIKIQGGSIRIQCILMSWVIQPAKCHSRLKGKLLKCLWLPYPYPKFLWVETLTW